MIYDHELSDLAVGDVVQVFDERWGEGVSVTGPLTVSPFGSLIVGEIKVPNPNSTTDLIPLVVKRDGGRPNSIHSARRRLVVVSRVPRKVPFYVNAPRDPVAGDVFRDADVWSTDSKTYSPSTLDGFWDNTDGSNRNLADLPATRRLLIDGSTGQVVP